KDALITDRSRDAVPVKRADCIVVSGQEFAYLTGEAFCEKKEVLEWNILAKGHKMHLVVAGNLITHRIQQSRAVGSPFANCVDVPNEKICPEFSRDVLHSRSEIGVFVEVKGSRSF